MQRLKRFSVFFMVITIAFVAGVYYEKLINSFYPHRENTTVEKLDLTVVKDDEIITAIQSEEVITADTKLITVEHNLETGEEISSESSIPIKYIGLNRMRFLEEMEIYEYSPALSDVKKGFRSLEVLSFSKAEVIVQKNYKRSATQLHYYIVSKDNMLVVYYEDLETIFLTTEISMDRLPENVQLEILQKKYFETEEELYNFLESYSS